MREFVGCKGAAAWRSLFTLDFRSGVTLKTRKRNIVIPVDPGSFANAVVHLVEDAAEGLTTLEEQLEAGTKALDNANNLEFSRYSDTLFEVFFAGGMLAAGGKLAGDVGVPHLRTNVGQHAACARVVHAAHMHGIHAVCRSLSLRSQPGKLSPHMSRCLPLWQGDVRSVGASAHA